MKLFVLPAILGIIMVSGCVDNSVMSCDDYCLDQPHIECVGEWRISGTYPDCVCGWECEVVEPTCAEYCSGLDTQCDGEWNITGEYPDCFCDCYIPEPDRIEVSQKPDDTCDYLEVTLDMGESVDVFVDGQKHVLNITKVNEEGLATIVVDRTFIKIFGLLEPFETLGGVGINVRDIQYVQGGTSYVTMRIGEHRVNSPIDCYGLQ